MNEQLMKALVDVVVFLALSDDDVLDPDAAIEQLEHVAATLKKMPAADRKQFLGFVATAAKHAQTSGHDERAEFLQELSEQLGIVG
jgi:hypothetical protein